LLIDDFFFGLKIIYKDKNSNAMNSLSIMHERFIHV